MHPCAHTGTVPGDLDAIEALAGLEHRGDRLIGVGEHRHHPVAEALDDVAVMAGHRRLDRLGDRAQELERDVVAGLERPIGEADQVGEHDRQAAPRRACSTRRPATASQT